jgi:hypothetical protein
MHMFSLTDPDGHRLFFQTPPQKGVASPGESRAGLIKRGPQLRMSFLGPALLR